MTKYELRVELAGKAMQGMISNDAILQRLNIRYSGEDIKACTTIAREAVILADALIAELDRTSQENKW